MKLSSAQTKLLAQVRKATEAGGRYGVQNRQFASAEVLLREGLVIDVTDRATDCTQFLALAKTPELPEYECCGIRFPESAGKYGCPNCLGDNVAVLVSSIKK